MRDAIARTLGFNDGAKALADLLDAHAALAEGSAGVFRSADRIVFSPAAPPPARIAARLDALGVWRSVEDLSKPEVVAGIDRWVSETTNGMIPEILGGPLENASFVALDALHFKAEWKTPFDRARTALAPFRSVDGTAADVAMMRLPEARRAFRTDARFIGVDLPFAGDRFSFVVVTTRDEPAPAKDFAAVADWLSGAGFFARKGALALPRLKLSGRAELLAILDSMGLGEGRSSPTALDGFGEGSQLSQVLQRAALEVDEKGAEAAAATAVVVTRSFLENDSLHMTVDKPFLFALRDRSTGLVLVAGYVGHAPEQSLIPFERKAH
jgi:serpin B